MNISIVSLFPHIYDPFLATSLIKRAQDEGHVHISVRDLFDYCAPKERVDGATFAPGSGMVIRPEVVERAVDERESAAGSAYKVFFSPHGQTLTQPLLARMYDEAQSHGHMALFPARYEGMDARIEQVYADRIISIGNYVLMGGDVPAMALLEGMLRYIPGVVGKFASVAHESFMGPFVDYPEYTRPVTWKGITVPDVLRSGDHHAIATWRLSQSVQRTVHRHFGWLSRHQLTDTQKSQVRQHIPAHYLVAMHTDVVLPGERIGETSITSIDVHDIARSARTYGVEKVYIVTPLKDQQKIAERLLAFWNDTAAEYHVNRQEAVTRVALAESLDSVISKIKESHPRVGTIATTAHARYHETLTYADQGQVWPEYDALVFVLGTGLGLSAACIQRCQYVFEPIEGLTQYNHLSVRSAAAVMLDRWLGVQNIYKGNNHGIQESE